MSKEISRASRTHRHCAIQSHKQVFPLPCLKSDAVDVTSSSQLGVDAVLGEEVDRTALNVDAEVVVVPSKIVEAALIEAAPPHHVLHHVPVLHPLLLVQLHREQILALPIGEVAGDEDERGVDEGEGRGDVGLEVGRPERVVDAEMEIGELDYPHHRLRSALYLYHSPAARSF